MHEWVADGSRKRSNKDLGPALQTTVSTYTECLLIDYTHPLSQVLRNSSKTNCCVGSDTRLLIIGCASQEPQQLSIDHSITKLVDHWNDSLDCLFSHHGSNISEARSLCMALAASYLAGLL